MQAVTMYKANDGSLWKNEAEAIERDSVDELVAQAMKIIPARPKHSLDNEYVQHSRQDLIRCKTALFEIAKAGPLKWWIDNQKAAHGKTEKELIEVTHPSWFGRMLDGTCGPLGNAYSRLCCIDSEDREWEQPYHANHTPAGPIKQIN
jgi:hypothetical protein